MTASNATVEKKAVLKEKALTQEQLVIQAARVNRDVFKAYVLKDDAGGDVMQAEIHRSWTRHIERCVKAGKRCAILAPWGHGKTEQCIIGEALWLIGHNPNLRIKIVSNTDPNARARIVSIRKYLTESEEFKRVFPGCVPDRSQKWNDHELFVKRQSYSKDPSLQAFGILSAGIGGRADVILFDDPVDLKNAIVEPGSREKVIDAVKNTWLSRLDPKDYELDYCEVLWVATVWHVDDATNAYIRKNGEFCVLMQALNDDMTAIDSRVDNADAVRVELWKEKFSTEVFVKKLREIGPRAFERGYRNKPWSDEDIVMKSFARCLDYSKTPQEAMKYFGGRWVTYSGIDLAGKNRAGFAIFTGALGVDNNIRIPLDIRVGAWSGSQAVDQCFEVEALYRPEVFEVENNGCQGVFEDYLRASGKGFIKTEPFLTGAEKADPSVGVNGLDIEFYNGLWVFALAHVDHRDMPECRCPWCRLIQEIQCYPLYDTTDCLMAMWFVREKMRNGMSMDELLAGIMGAGERIGAQYPGSGRAFAGVPDEMMPDGMTRSESGLMTVSRQGRFASMGHGWN